MHMPGHIRDTFLRAVEAMERWQPGKKPPTVEHEVNYEPRQISLVEACHLVWNCTDVLPGSEYHFIKTECDVPNMGGSYAAAARQLKAWIEREEAREEARRSA